MAGRRHGKHVAACAVWELRATIGWNNSHAQRGGVDNPSHARHSLTKSEERRRAKKGKNDDEEIEEEDIEEAAAAIGTKPNKKLKKHAPRRRRGGGGENKITHSKSRRPSVNSPESSVANRNSGRTGNQGRELGLIPHVVVHEAAVAAVV